MSNHVKLMLDSGAFSAYKQGKPVILEEYIEYCLHNRKAVWCPVALDCIPGTPDKRPTITETEEAAAQSFRNCEKMRKAGIEPMPVFHQTEDFKWLRKMLDADYKYIGISPMKSFTVAERTAWLDQVFWFLTGGQPFTDIKTHAFGVSIITQLLRYPWYTADSTTWLKAGCYGSIMLPAISRGLPRYDLNPDQLGVATARTNDPASAHYFGDREKEHLRKLVKKEFDMKLEDLSHHDATRLRQRQGIRYFLKVEQAAQGGSFRPQHAPLMMGKVKSRHGTEKSSHPFHFIFSSGIEQSDVLHEEGVTHRLHSFWYLRKNTPDLTAYARTGVHVKPPKRVKRAKA